MDESYKTPDFIRWPQQFPSNWPAFFNNQAFPAQPPLPQFPTFPQQLPFPNFQQPQLPFPQRPQKPQQPSNFVPTRFPSLQAVYPTFQPFNPGFQPLPVPMGPNFVNITPRPPQKPNKNKKKKPASTTVRPITSSKPIKLLDARPKPEKLVEKPKEVKMDLKVFQAVQQPNSKFVVEKFQLVPGTWLGQYSTAPQRLRNVQLKELKFQRQEIEKSENDLEDQEVVADAMGMTSADQPIPDIDFGTYFPGTTFKQPGENGDEATLILEPSAKAIAGNDGTAISAPLSHAIIRKGTSVKVLFRPQSIALAGVGGVAHAQADLILDFVE